jgi:hypothetical protein
MSSWPEKLILVEDNSTVIRDWQEAIEDLSWVTWVAEQNYSGADLTIKNAVETSLRLNFSPRRIHEHLLNLAKEQPDFFRAKSVAYDIDSTASFDAAENDICNQTSAILWLDFKLDDPAGNASDPVLTKHYTEKLETDLERLPEEFRSDWRSYEHLNAGGCLLALQYGPIVSPDATRLLVQSTGLGPNTLQTWGGEAVTRPAAMRQGLPSVYASILIGLNQWCEIQEKRNRSVWKLWNEETDRWFLHSKAGIREDAVVPHNCDIQSPDYERAAPQIRALLENYFRVPPVWLEDHREWDALYRALKSFLGEDTSVCSGSPNTGEQRCLRLSTAVLFTAMAAPGEWIERVRLSEVEPWPLVVEQTQVQARHTFHTFFQMIRTLTAGNPGIVDVQANRFLQITLPISCTQSRNRQPLLKSLIRGIEVEAGDSGRAIIAFKQAVSAHESEKPKPRCSVHLRPENQNHTVLEITTWDT